MIRISPFSTVLRDLAFGICVMTISAVGQNLPECKNSVLTLSEAADLLRVEEQDIARLAEQAKLPGRRIGSSWRFTCAALMEWLNGDLTPAQTGGVPTNAGVPSPVTVPPMTGQGLSAVTATGITRSQSGAGATQSQVATSQDAPVGEAPEERPAEDIFLRGERVLLGPGDMVIDFGQFYARKDDYLLASVTGGVALATVRQRAFTSLFTARVGIFNETELYAGTAFSSQSDDAFLDDVDLSSSSDNVFHGVNFGVRRTLFRERGKRPDIIVTIDGHIPGRESASGLGGGVVLVKSVDPVVLFANGGYLHSFRRQFSGGTVFLPEDRFAASMGYGLALNDTLAMSMSVSGAFSGSTDFGNTRLMRRASSFSGRIGLTSWLARGLYIEPSVSFGLTGPGKSVAFGLTLPYAF